MMGGAPAAEVIIPPEWMEAADAISRRSLTFPPVVLICGPKNSGKSTFSRHLLNTLLQSYEKVGYLDTDVGQPEFGLPGVVSLHIVDEIVPDLSTSSFRELERCFFFGDVSSKRDPSAYLTHIRHLNDYFLKEYHKADERDRHLPLIVNTPGWVKGNGFDLLVDMLRCISPTQVVQIRISAERKNLPLGAFWLDHNQHEPVELIYISSARRDSLDRSLLVQKDARSIRDLRIFEYFKQCFPESMGISSNKELAYALASLPPYEVSLSSIKVLHLHCQVPHSEIFHSLNATIVGLAVSSDPVLSQGSIYWCAGLGIVRAVDATKGLIYVITPVCYPNLEKVDVLLQGFIEIPTALLQVRGCVSPYMLTNVLNRLPDKDF